MTTPDTIRVFVPLEYRRRNGRTQILPPENRLDAEDRQQDPHILRTLARAWNGGESWRPARRTRSAIWPPPKTCPTALSAAKSGLPILRPQLSSA